MASAFGSACQPPSRSVAVQREGVRLVPVRGEDRGERVGHATPRWLGPPAGATCPLPAPGRLRRSRAGRRRVGRRGPGRDGPEPADGLRRAGAAARRSLRPPPLPAARGSGAGPAVLLGHLQADQAGRSRGRAVGGLVVVEAGQDPGRPRARCTADPGPRVGVTGSPARRPSTSSRADVGGHVVEELPVHHHDRRVVAGGVALHVLQADLAVRRGLVVARPRGARGGRRRSGRRP